MAIKKTAPVHQIFSCIQTMSTCVADVEGNLLLFRQPELIDIGARIHAIKTRIEGIDDAVCNLNKSQLGKGIHRARYYEANIRIDRVTSLDVTGIKTGLPEKIWKPFERVQERTVLVYKPCA
jgi:hypothetical protein